MVTLKKNIAGQKSINIQVVYCQENKILNITCTS